MSIIVIIIIVIIIIITINICRVDSRISIAPLIVYTIPGLPLLSRISTTATKKSSPSWRQPATATNETSPLSARATILKLKGGRNRRRRQINVALIGEGDNFQSEGRPKLATATLQPSPMSANRYRRGRHLVPVSARATTHPSPKSASRYRRWRHENGDVFDRSWRGRTGVWSS